MKKNNNYIYDPDYVFNDGCSFAKTDTDNRSERFLTEPYGEILCYKDIKESHESEDSIIEGILSRQQIMLISGPSKSGKSFLSLNFAVAVSTGTEILGRACRKSRVLYIELENGNVETKKRITGILAQKGIDEDLPDSLFIYCLNRGFVDSYVRFFDEIIEKAKDDPFDLIIIDPIYMLLDGDENNSEVIKEFFKQISRLKTATGASIIMCHHESKGSNSAKNVVDRTSGSGVLSRYPDVLISLEPSNMSVLYRAKIKMVLRYYKSPEPLNVNFKDGAFLLDGESTEKNNIINSSSDSNKSKKTQFVVDRMRNEGR